MKILGYLLIICILLLIGQSAIASESPDILNEKIIKNFTYHLKYSEKTVTLKNGKYESPLRPGNKEDMENYLSVKLERYGIFKLNEVTPFAIVILSENFGGSGGFLEITVLLKEKDKTVQTNSIELGDRVVIEADEKYPLPVVKKPAFYLLFLNRD